MVVDAWNHQATRTEPQDSGSRHYSPKQSPDLIRCGILKTRVGSFLTSVMGIMAIRLQEPIHDSRSATDLDLYRSLGFLLPASRNLRSHRSGSRRDQRRLPMCFSSSSSSMIVQKPALITRRMQPCIISVIVLIIIIILVQ